MCRQLMLDHGPYLAASIESPQHQETTEHDQRHDYSGDGCDTTVSARLHAEVRFGFMGAPSKHVTSRIRHAFASNPRTRSSGAGQLMHPRGGELAALSATLCETAKLVDLDPEAHLRARGYTAAAGRQLPQQHLFVNSRTHSRKSRAHSGRGDQDFRIHRTLLRTPSCCIPAGRRDWYTQVQDRRVRSYSDQRPQLKGRV